MNEYRPIGHCCLEIAWYTVLEESRQDPGAAVQDEGSTGSVANRGDALYSGGR